jgi:protein disulfide-isomerase A1
VSSPADEVAAQAAILTVARKYSGRIQFGTVVGPIFESLVEDVHVKPDQWPSFAIHDITSNLKYPLSSTWEGQIKPEEIESFVEQFLAGQLEPAVKSQPIPEIQGPLVEVVGLTYKEIVLDNDRDVLVEYYTEDCAPCEVLVPELEKLARAYACDEKEGNLVTVAKMNLDENDALDRDIRGFPFIKLYPAGKKNSPVTYRGDQRAVAWATFIKENGTHGVEVNVQRKDVMSVD